jgi:hypothetical protein
MSRSLPAISRVSTPDSLERLLRALNALRELAEQTVDELLVSRLEVCAALSRAGVALDDFHAALEQELHDRHTIKSPFYALLTEHVRRCAARQRADLARLSAQAERPEISLTTALRATWALVLVMRIEVAQLARDVRL